MNQYSILKMAREAGLLRAGDGWTEPHRWGITELERFAALVAAAERKRIESRPWGAGKEWIARAVEAEREACAEMVAGMNVQHPKHIAAAIRARGEK
jgi:hypothetical protein